MHSCPRCNCPIPPNAISPSRTVCCPECHQVFQVPLPDSAGRNRWLAPLGRVAIRALILAACVASALFVYQLWFASPSDDSSSPNATRVVEEEPPNAVPLETPGPVTAEVRPTPAQTVEAESAATKAPDPLEWLRQHRDRWPSEIHNTLSVEFPAFLQGKVVGNVKLPAGTTLSLATIEQDTVVAGYAGTTSRLPISMTDLATLARQAMARPEPTPLVASAEPTATPEATPLSEEVSKWHNQFKADPRTLGQSTAPAKPEAEEESAGRGHATYTFHRAKDPDEELKKIEEQCEKSLEEATKIYNKFTKLKIHLNVSYNPGTPTADCSFGGSMRLGHSRNTRTVLHEMGHAFGVGTHGNWGKLMVNGLWQGKRANKLLQKFTGDPKAQLHGDRMHMWPYGLNYDTEVKSPEDFKRSCLMVEAVVQDLQDAK